MRIVIVNSCHPDTSHVCALRARAFGDALTEMGHRILLLTPPLGENGRGTEPAALVERLETQDWSHPCAVTGGMRQDSILPAVRSGRVPAGLRQAFIAWQYLLHGNVYEDWCAGTRPLIPTISEQFRPDVVWAVFGNTGCWQIGRELARRAGCPWIADLKDSWTNFIPSVFRAHLAGRYGDAASLTVLSATHAETIAGFMPKVPRTIVYSGIPPEFLTRQASSPPAAEQRERLILLTGGTYGLVEETGTLLDSLARWLASEPAAPGRDTVFAYAGADTEAVSTAAHALEGSCTVRMLGFVPLKKLHALQKEAALNLYLRCPPFHHKVFELFAAGRPILCYPGESAETINLAANVGALFFSCETQDDLGAAFSQALGAHAPTDRIVDAMALARYSWEAQAKTLETVLDQAVEGR